jgi:hypothetical protein
MKRKTDPINFCPPSLNSTQPLLLVETIHGKILLKTFTPITKKEMMAHFALHSKASTAIIHYSFFSQKTTKFSNFVLFSKKKNQYFLLHSLTPIHLLSSDVHFAAACSLLAFLSFCLKSLFTWRWFSVQYNTTILRWHFLSILFFCWLIDAIWI